MFEPVPRQSLEYRSPEVRPDEYLLEEERGRVSLTFPRRRGSRTVMVIGSSAARAAALTAFVIWIWLVTGFAVSGPALLGKGWIFFGPSLLTLAAMLSWGELLYCIVEEKYWGHLRQAVVVQNGTLLVYSRGWWGLRCREYAGSVREVRLKVVRDIFRRRNACELEFMFDPLFGRAFRLKPADPDLPQRAAEAFRRELKLQ